MHFLSLGLLSIGYKSHINSSISVANNFVPKDPLIELGAVLKLGIYENTKTIITDFYGIGSQDVVIAEFVLSTL
mgnify:CR=1 FL=1